MMKVTCVFAYSMMRATNLERIQMQRYQVGLPSELLGEEAVLALRSVCIPGVDVSVLMKLVDRYVYNHSDGRYIDRERFRESVEHYMHSAEDLYRRHKPDVIMIGGKPKEAFKSFEMSKMRVEVGDADLFPIKAPGVIFRSSRSK